MVQQPGSTEHLPRSRGGGGFDVARFEADLGVKLPGSLTAFWAKPPKKLQHLWYRPGLPVDDPLSVAAAMGVLQSGAMPVPAGLVPVSYVDARSLACVVCAPANGEAPGIEGQVVRWHLDAIPLARQGAVLDQDVRQYSESVIEDVDAYEAGYRGAKRYRGRTFKGILAVAADYEAAFGLGEGRRPKPEHLRPFQLACQNVIVGLAAMRHEPRLNALMVEYWQTCEVPHVATHEANRALSALMLCDAFQAGGTMEINFERHPEGKVPAVLRRFGRSVHVDLGRSNLGDGATEGASISPSEARALFLAVTPMSSSLRARIDQLAATGAVSVERVCYSLLSPVWRPIELEFILGCSARAVSILNGGAQFDDHASRQPEIEVARAALLVGMYHRRLDNKDLAAGADRSDGVGTARVFDDASNGVLWKVIDEAGAVEFSNVPKGLLPWQRGAPMPLSSNEGRVVVLPRPHPLPFDTPVVARLSAEVNAPVVVIAPLGTSMAGLDGMPVLTCPEGLAALDAQIERNFLSSRLART